MYIVSGLDDYAYQCAVAAEKAMCYAAETATEEEFEDFKDFMRTHFRMYGEKMMQKAPSMKNEIRKIMEEVGLC